MRIKSILILSICFCWLKTSYTQKILNTSQVSIGERLEIRSEILDENRVLNIYLPQDYSPDSIKIYPVIFLLDGSMDEDFIHIAGLTQFASFSWINMIPEMIVVGIANIDRKRDFTFPSRNEEDNRYAPTSGKSEDFIRFIEEELIPFVEREYKTSSEKILMGQSLGGLLATEVLYKKPDLFTDYIIISPSLWWDDESMVDFVPTKFDSEKSIFIGVGNEGYGMKELAEGMYDKLMLLKNKNVRLNFKYFEKQDHGDVLHQAAYEAFEQLYVEEKK